MSQYHAPLAEMHFVLTELAGLDQVATLPGFEEATPDTAAAILDEAAKFATNVLDPLNVDRRSRGLAPAGRRQREDAAGLQGRLPAVLRQRLERSHQVDGVRRPGPAAAPRHRGRGDVALVEPRVQPVPDADAGRDRGDRASRLAEAQGALSPEDGRRHVDRHDEPHRAAGGLGPRGRAHARRSAGRRHVQALRPEDLHHLRRARLHREHHPPGARAHAGCAGRRQGHLAFRRAEVPGQRRRQPRARATTSSAFRSSTSSASTRARPR